ncbi:MAG TPA: hypothetical protein VHU86_08885 [Solirubrobacterales bacterium]|nr:hypothetical protein [Solirubrobacterales bacterium]
MAGAAVAIVLAVGGSTEPVEPAEANLALCGPGEGVGASPAAQRNATARAGPVAVAPRPLRGMRRDPNGQLYTRMSILVRGHRFVVLSVPLELRNRVFLYYGQILDNRGRTAASLFRAPGYAETELQPCRHETATVWSGGVRVIGAGPVRLLVTVEGRSRSIPLLLGRPRIGPRAT